MKSPFITVTVALTQLLLVMPPAKGMVLYQVTDLGTVNGSTRSEARGINQYGEIWGENFNTDYPYFLWKNGTNHGIAKPTEVSAMSLYGMNDVGQFAGFCSFTIPARNFAFVGSPYWPIPLATNFSPKAVNFHGVVAGVASIKVEIYPGGPLATVNRPAFAIGQQLTILPSLAGSSAWLNAEATAINDNGAIVGWSATTNNVTHAFLWDGTMHDLHTLGTRSNSVATAINNIGIVAGNMYDYSIFRSPFVWTAGSGMTPLGLPGGYSTSQPLGLNNRGDVVGVADSSAVIWTNGVMTDLQTVIPTSPSWDLDGAYGINDAGQIVGYGKSPGGGTHGFLLQPTNVPLAQLTVELLDPGDPSLTNVLTSFYVTTNRTVLNALATRRVGIAADGASRLLLRASTTNHGTVAFSLLPADGATGVTSFEEQNGGVGNLPAPGGLPFSLDHDTPTEATAQGIRAYALYHAPDQYHRTGLNDSALVQRIINLQAIFTPNSGTAITQSVAIVIARPPLLVLHGVWSNPTEAFGGFIQSFRAAEAGVQIFAPSYSNAVSFASNRPVVPREIENACAAYREQNFAATRVDIFAHSMGGVLSRIYAARDDYKRPENYQRGDINRLVTIDSPHRGAFIADDIDAMLIWLSQNGFGGARMAIETEMSALKMPPNLGAGYDLMSSSAEIVQMNLRETDVAAHVIVGDYTISLNPTNMPSPFGGFFSLINDWCPPGVNLADRFFAPIPGTDLVVSRDSQAAGLDGSNSCSVFNMIHVGAANNTNVINKCWLLYLTVPPHLWWSKGFPTGWAPAPVPPPLPPPPSPTTTNNSSILVLLASSVKSGASASASVSEPSGTSFSSVLLLTRDVAMTDTNAPFDFTFTVPASAVGDYPVSYFATDTASNLWWGTQMLSVTPFASLNYLAAGPRRFIFNHLGDQEQIVAIGVYYDIARDVTDPSTGTTYSSADTNIVFVETNGVMTARGNGETQITVSFGGQTAYVNAVVNAVPVPDLALGETVSATNVPAGAAVTFTLRVTNVGPQTATGVYLAHTLPADAQFQSATLSQGAWSFTNGTFAAGLEALAPGSNALATVTVSFANGGPHVGTATVSSLGLDANDADNEAAATVNVTVLPMLTIQLSGTKVILSWPTNASGFELERTLDLSSPSTWNAAATNPPAIGDHFEISLLPTNAATYFRLRHP